MLPEHSTVKIDDTVLNEIGIRQASKTLLAGGFHSDVQDNLLSRTSSLHRQIRQTPVSIMVLNSVTYVERVQGCWQDQSSSVIR